MSAFLTSLIAAAAIAFGAYWFLERLPGRSSADRAASDSVRLDASIKPSVDGRLGQ